MAEELKLYGTWVSPFSRRVELALKLKGIPYEYIEEDLHNKSPDLIKYNPIHQKVPVLVHNGKPIVESLVILEYIDETWKNNPILPQDPYQRALARFWAKFIEEKILPLAMKVTNSEEKEKEKVVVEMFQLMKVLEGELNGKDFFGGESIGYVDIVATIIAVWFQVTQEVIGVKIVSEEKFPVLFKWIEKLKSIDVVKECIPPRDKHITYVKARIEAALLKSAPN
ncbi:glutathione S-transferase U7-like [Pistacia vera]|uniref:glutathione S-transferase U7-like n=1 Tax=Pistacia vera TaxID=55513 RepID=UPI001263C418|nr:glutathione S-transferase U7-like [Pistacia vera]